MNEKRKTIYAHFPPFEARPKVKPRIWKVNGGYWVCGLSKRSHNLYADVTAQKAYEGWMQFCQQFN